MGISDDIQRKRPKKQQLEEVPVAESHIQSEDVSDIIEPLPDTYEEHTDLNEEKSGFFAPEKAKPESPFKKSKSLWLLGLLILLVVLLISVAIYQNLDVIKRKLTKTPDTEVTTSQTKEVSGATDTNTTTPSQDTTTPTTTTTPAVTTSPTIDKSSFTIRVSNGNGLRGSADKVRDILKAAGFNVTSVGNASRYNYPTTIVYYKTGKEAEANLVKEALSNRSTSTQLSPSLTTYDILVVVGSK